MAEVQDRSRPILAVGCRSAGSYFAPILHACLKLRGWESVDSTTIRPNIGTSPSEDQKLAAVAANCGIAVLTDEPIGTGSTLIKAIRLLQRTKIARGNIVALFPVHLNSRDCYAGSNGPALKSIRMITLLPEERHKEQVLDARNVDRALKTYFERDNEFVESVVADDRSAWLESLSEATSVRLKVEQNQLFLGILHIADDRFRLQGL